MQLKNLKTKRLGKNNVYYDVIDSTQNEVWRLYKTGVPSGTLVMAGVQTAGKGTHGRVWHTDKKNNIAFSFFIRMECNISKLEGITIEIAQIIVEIFKEMYNINLSIKKPNDIVYNGKKIGGILTQTKVAEEQVKALVIGIGINTSQREFAEDIKDIATSIKKEFDIDVDNEKIIAEFCNRFEAQIIDTI